MFQQVATEKWDIETSDTDDVSLAQALYDAIATSAGGYVMVTVNAQNEFVISTGVDAEAMEN